MLHSRVHFAARGEEEEEEEEDEEEEEIFELNDTAERGDKERDRSGVDDGAL